MIGKVLIAGVALVIGVYFQSSVDGLDCLSCKGAVNISDCLSQTATCKDNEEQCYLDKVINPDLNAVFNAGCRAKLICDLITGSGKRSASKRQSTACAQCCNAGPDAQNNIPCNGYLCNQVPQAPGDTCAVCDRVSNVDSCTISEQCPNNEICSIKYKISGNAAVYELGCEQKTVCDTILRVYRETHNKPAGRSDHGDVELCAACCKGRNCNKANCGELIKNQTCNDPAICGP